MTTLRLLAAVALMACTSPAFAAFVVIDSFNNPNPGQFYIVPAGGVPAVFSHATEAATRNTTLIVDVGSGSNALSGSLGFSGFFNDGVLEFDSNAFTRARAILLYDNFTGTNSNFTTTGIPKFINLNFLNMDPGINVSTNMPALDIPIDVAISTTSGTLSGTFFLGQSAVPVQYQVPIESLSGFGDLSQVLSLTITINGGIEQRQRVDYVMSGVTLETEPVPAPPAVFLGLASVPLLAWLRKRRG